MKKTLLILITALLICISLASASEMCIGVPGCEGETSPRNFTGFWSVPPTFCEWVDVSSPHLYFDRCAGGNWFYHGPDDTGTVDGYVCYYCDRDGSDCSIIRDLINGNSKPVCYGCDCGDYLSGFPAPPCAPLTGNSCVDEKCCVGVMEFKNAGEYVSCVAEARKECGLIPAAGYTEIQREAAKSKISNPTGSAVVSNPQETTWMGLVSVISIIGLVAVSLTSVRKK